MHVARSAVIRFPLFLAAIVLSTGEASDGSEMIFEYSGGGKNFGGTMGYVIDGSSPDSNLAIILGSPGGMGPALFIPLVGMGEQATGATATPSASSTCSARRTRGRCTRTVR